MKSFHNSVIYKAIYFAILFEYLTCSEATKISQITPPQIRSQNSEVQFNCTIEDYQGQTLAWLKLTPTANNLAINTNLLFKSNRFFVNLDENTSTYSLKIKEIVPSDTAVYQCLIQLDENNKIIADVKLDVERAPEITEISPNSVFILEGDSVNIECKATGFPMPNISWKRKDNLPISFDENSLNKNLLRILKADKTDRGIYYCIANNTIEPIAEAPVQVTINFAPVVDTPRPKIGQAKGHTVKLECHVEASPIPKIIWLKDDKIIALETPNPSTDEFIHVHYIHLIGSTDYGFYTCRAENDHGVTETIIQIYETGTSWDFTE